MPERSSIETLAELLIEARRTGVRIPRSRVEGLTMDEIEALAVQKLVAGSVGPVSAYKTGRKAPGDRPSAAPIFATHVRPSGSVFWTRELGACGIELEIAFRVDRPLPAPGPGFETALRGCVSPLPAIELVDGRIEGFLDLPPGLKLADNQMNGGFIFGNPVSEWDPADLATPRVTLRIAGETVIDGTRQVPGGNAFDNLVAFLATADYHGYQPQVGDMVTTGSLTGMPFAEAPCHFEGHIAGLGAVRGDYVL